MVRALLLGAAVLFMSPSTLPLCTGFLPENNLYISVNDPALGGLSKTEFDSVLDQIERFYTPVVAAKGGRLNVNRDWNSGTVNASANRSGNTYTINMYGGLARHPAISKDAFMMVACHEIGHHLGGAPKIASWWGGTPDWASNEGESDYFASLRCLRYMFHESDNLEFVQTQTVDPDLRTRCEQVYDTQAEENLCMRIGMAGYDGAMLFQKLKELPEVLRFTSPDQNKVTKTDDDHPAPQCRLDTYFQGAICRHDMTVELSDNNPLLGTCNESMGQTDGIRPRCWYAP